MSIGIVVFVAITRYAMFTKNMGLPSFGECIFRCNSCFKRLLKLMPQDLCLEACLEACLKAKGEACLKAKGEALQISLEAIASVKVIEA